MGRIVLISLLECNNGCSCELHPFGCGNSLVLNRDDWGVGLHLCMRTTKSANKLACYIIKSNGSDDCHVGFTARKYASRNKRPQLDGAMVERMTIFMPDSENRSMRRLIYHNCGYAYTIVLT